MMGKSASVVGAFGFACRSVAIATGPGFQHIVFAIARCAQNFSSILHYLTEEAWCDLEHASTPSDCKLTIILDFALR